ncbi:hypothetical protein B0H63DRAFT_63710 [Podospora didyma]|uniref:Uncharacterized protein n=1 Tax=Podospora didyma TaxID=330526 RepID=A0AAE0P834_9PEZI|nr:hypothetical protein B0H63DRAFT_63710 [Podospora didyma]
MFKVGTATYHLPCDRPCFILLFHIIAAYARGITPSLSVFSIRMPAPNAPASSNMLYIIVQAAHSMAPYRGPNHLTPVHHQLCSQGNSTACFLPSDHSPPVVARNTL